MEPHIHKIEKLIFNLRFSSENSAMKTRSYIAALTGEAYEKLLDEALSEFGTNGEILFIDRIDLNLGTIMVDDFEGAAMQMFIRLLKEKINEKLTGKKAKEAGYRILNKEKSYLEILLHFLRSGQLPWWSSIKSLEELESLLITGNVLIHDKARASLRAELQIPIARKRMAWQFSTGFQLHLIKALFPSHFLFIGEMVERLPGILSKSISSDPDKIRQELFFISWTILFRSPDKDPAGGFPGHVVSEWCLRNAVQPEKILPVIRPYLSPESQTILEQPEIRKREKKQFMEKPTAEKEQSYTISNAGLVILWPYLETLFTFLGYLEDMKFINTGLQERALGITQYLVTGEEYMEEHQLILNKIITGWPLGMPVRNQFYFSEQEKAECDQLLNSVIRDWPVLKTTSIEGLQETFLGRTGRLQFKEKECFIRVERTGVDVLLDLIPWNISMIRLPWIKPILYVEW